jgi:GNAT superfamily N-acetyltransferase
MVRSPLLRRYRVTRGGAEASLRAAYLAGDGLLAVRRDAIVGMAWLSFAPRMLDGAAYLRLLLVDEQAQRQGLGAQLLDTAEGIARERANHLYLLATTDNLLARGFYERHGYRHVGGLPGLVWPDLDEALYHKPVRAYAERLNG